MHERMSRLIGMRRFIPLLAALAVGDTVFAQPITGPSSIAPGTSAISGVLIDSQTKQPIAGCMVGLNQVFVPRNPSASTTTDSNGAYAFSGIAAADYHVNAFCETHLPSCYRSEGADPLRCDTISVVVDQRKSNIDLNLVQGATASGKVIDETNRPIAGATVRLGRPRVDTRYGMSRSARTNRDGTFTLTNLPPGGFLLEVDPPQEPGALRPPIIYFPGVLQFGDADFIELVSGRTTKDVTIVAPRLADNRLTVRVVMPEPTDVDVSFVRVEPLVTRKVAIDDSGTGTITGMAPGRYFLAARAQSSEKILTAHESVDIFGGEQEILLYLQRASRIAGRLVGEKGTAPLLDGVRVSATWIEDGVAINPLAAEEAAVGLDGTFRFDGVFGTRQLQVMGLDPEWQIRSITQDRSDVTAVGVTLAADTEAKVVIVVGRR